MSADKTQDAQHRRSPQATGYAGRSVKPSIVRRKQDAEIVKASLHANNGAPYSPEMNPYAGRDAFRAERFERHYTNWRAGWLRADSHIRDVCEAYGVQRHNARELSDATKGDAK